MHKAIMPTWYAVAAFRLTFRAEWRPSAVASEVDTHTVTITVAPEVDIFCARNINLNSHGGP